MSESLDDHLSHCRANTMPKRADLAWTGKGTYLLVTDASAAAHASRFLQTAPEGVEVTFMIEPDAAALGDYLSRAKMGLRLLAIGAEPFLQRLHAIAWQYGLSDAALGFALRGGNMRDVLCMSCRSVERALQRIHSCSQCDTQLLVRDHFAPRLGLYQGAPLAQDDPLIAALGGSGF